MFRAEYVFEKTKDEKLDRERRISYVQRMLSSCANLIEKNKKYTLEIKNAPLTFQDTYKIENEHLQRCGEYNFRGELRNITQVEATIQERYEKVVIEIEEIKGESDESFCN